MTILDDIFNTSSDLVKAAKRENASRKILRAAEDNKLSLVKSLLNDGADINRQNKNGDTPLIGAARFGSTETAEFLIRSGADINRKNYKGDTALIAAARSNRPGIIKALLDKGVKVDAPNYSGETALIIAVRYGDKATVVALLEKGANPIQKNKQGQSLIEVANKLYRNGSDIAAILQDAITAREKIVAEKAAAVKAEKLNDQRTNAASKQNNLKEQLKNRPKPKIGPG